MPTDKRKHKTKKRPHSLDLYRHAVQHPEAEVDFLFRAYGTLRNGAWATRLKEDFAGEAHVAATWVAVDEDHRAVALEADHRIVNRAAKALAHRLGDRAEDLHLICADVMSMGPDLLPKVDVTVALNFSALIWQTRDAMLAYLKHARRLLDREGIFVMDLYGGPGAMRPGRQTRRVTPHRNSGIEPFVYIWEQRSFDPLTARVDNRIHFELADGSVRQNAFRYDWRLWTLPEMLELLHDAGYRGAAAWCDTPDAPGRFERLTKMPAREDWVAYIVAER